MSDELLNETTARQYAFDRGIIRDVPCQVTALTGGVSNVVLLLESEERRIVIKQALPQLRVTDKWLADPSRAQAEAAALGVLHNISPTAVPELLDDDPGRHALTISAAPSEWQTWKAEILAGTVRPWIANRLGELLSQWHRVTDQTPLPKLLEELHRFEQLRLTPYFGTTGRRRPDLRASLDQLVNDIKARQRCLVLGDFSPKNVLVGPDDLWVIDLEVAHRGDPAFDVGFLLCHLAAKSVYLPERSSEIDEAARGFIASYGDAPAMDDQSHLARVLGGLLLARVFGSSPLEYLNSSQRSQLASNAERLLQTSSQSIIESWEVVTAL